MITFIIYYNLQWFAKAPWSREMKNFKILYKTPSIITYKIYDIVTVNNLILQLQWQWSERLNRDKSVHLWLNFSLSLFLFFFVWVDISLTVHMRFFRVFIVKYYFYFCHIQFFKKVTSLLRQCKLMMCIQYFWFLYTCALPHHY